VAMSGADPGRIAETNFVLGFSLLWADEVDEAADVLERAVFETGRVGDRIHENRARAYHAVALRRAGRVDEAVIAARSSLELATRLEDSYYQGHAHSVLCWADWRRGNGNCRRTGRMAFEAWGTHQSGENIGLDTEFAWMAVWPLAADARDRYAPEEAQGYLRYLQVPWERPLPAELALAVDTAIGDPEALERSLDLAKRYRFL
jgi:hypothetical protein